jgi:diguanylate cyclase (GGDEF)-like protein
MERLIALRSYRMVGQPGEALLDDVVRLAARVTRSSIALVTLVDEDYQHLTARHGLDVERTPRAAAFCAHAILDPGRPLIVPDATLDVRFSDNPLVLGAPDIRAYLGVPLVTMDGHALGTLCIIDRTPREHDDATIETISSLARTVVTALELRRAMQRVQTLALTDSLTSLPNRPAFLDALSRAIARQQRDDLTFSLLYLDLDGFKALNDSQGHAAGDRALVEVASVLRESVRRHDLPARLGGDEFGLLLVGGDGAEATVAGQRVRRAIARRMAERGWPVTATIGGVAFHSPPEDEGAALVAADSMMYAAKQQGRDRVFCRDHGVRRPAPFGRQRSRDVLPLG